ncbi:MAG: DUF3102 domain-containing protein [Limisphaerales bacterium]
MSRKKDSPEQIEQRNQQLKECAEQLNQLQTDIESNNALSIKHGKIVLELALKAGAILCQAKQLVRGGVWKGQWQKWIEENVKGITVRTAENYMRLATEVAIEQERVKNKTEFGKQDMTKHVSFLADCEGLREAYLVTGIIKQPKMVDAAVMPSENDTTPERMKNENKATYGQKLSEARSKMIQRIRNEIKGAKRVNWDLSTWTIKNDKPCSGDESNFAAKLFNSLLAYLSLRNCSDITREDEVESKAAIILSEILKAIILANRPALSETEKPEDFFVQFGDKPQPVVEVAEKIAA